MLACSACRSLPAGRRDVLLQKLREYSERPDVAKDLAPAGYAPAAVRYIIDLDESGRFLGLVDNAGESRQEKRGRRRPMPQTARKTSGVLPLPFFGNGQYVLGVARATAKPGRAESEHAAFKALIETYAEAVQHPAVQAVREFYRAGESVPLPDEFQADDNVTFRVGETFVTDLADVQARWQQPRGRGPAPVMQCLVCGKQRPVLDRLEAKVKGIPGGQTAGTSIISANKKAFESYGLEASLTAPTCADCGERFTKGLNALLEADGHRVVFGGGVFAFWTREEVDFDFYNAMIEADPESIRTLIQSFKIGRVPVAVREAEFYAAVFSASGGRAVVRDWIDTTVGNVWDLAVQWFTRHAIVDWQGEEIGQFGLRNLAQSLLPRRGRDRQVDPERSRAILQLLTRGALTGAPLPDVLLNEAVRRNRSEQAVTHVRASLIKLVLLSQQPDTREGYMVRLEVEHPSIAYHCGRLLAVMEKIQRRAIPNVNTTIVDRFYGTASSSPASVFGTLLRNVQPHLAVLRANPATRGAAINLGRELEDVTSKVEGFPRTLKLQEQALFSLGYWHQRAYRYQRPGDDLGDDQASPDADATN